MDIFSLNEKGNKLYDKEDFIGALKCYKRMIKYCSIDNMAIIYYNIGLCYMSLYDYDNAEKVFQKSFNYGHLSAGFELSLSKLHLKKLEEGLDLYKYRYYNGDCFPVLPLKKVETYEDLRGNRIFVLNEQGFGDELLFSRSIEMMGDITEYTKYQIYDELYDVISNNFKYDNVDFFTDRHFNLEFIKDFDYWVPSGDLFVMWTKKYGFNYSPIKIKKEFEKDSVGICWKANSMSKNVKSRSIDPKKITPLLLGKLKYSLQKDEVYDGIISTKIDNFKDTLDIIEKVEMVYSIDTSVLHLALLTDQNQKVKLLYENYLDWRWNFPFYRELDFLIKIK